VVRRLESMVSSIDQFWCILAIWYYFYSRYRSWYSLYDWYRWPILTILILKYHWLILILTSILRF